MFYLCLPWLLWYRLEVRKQTPRLNFAHKVTGNFFAKKSWETDWSIGEGKKWSSCSGACWSHRSSWSGKAQQSWPGWGKDDEAMCPTWLDLYRQDSRGKGGAFGRRQFLKRDSSISSQQPTPPAVSWVLKGPAGRSPWCCQREPLPFPAVHHGR